MVAPTISRQSFYMESLSYLQSNDLYQLLSCIEALAPTAGVGVTAVATTITTTTAIASQPAPDQSTLKKSPNPNTPNAPKAKSKQWEQVDGGKVLAPSPTCLSNQGRLSTFS